MGENRLMHLILLIEFAMPSASVSVWKCAAFAFLARRKQLDGQRVLGDRVIGRHQNLPLAWRTPVSCWSKFSRLAGRQGTDCQVFL